MNPGLFVLGFVLAHLFVGVALFYVDRARVSCKAWTIYPEQEGFRNCYIEDNTSFLVVPLWPLCLVAMLFDPIGKLLRFVIFDSSENLGRSCAMRKKGGSYGFKGVGARSVKQRPDGTGFDLFASTDKVVRQ